MTDTIFALSSGQPPAAIGIIRVSGPGAREALLALAGRMPLPRRATLARIADPVTGVALDQALLLWFPGPATATGEDLAEIHCHGGRAVVAAIMAALGTLPGLRTALPGEFTRRAFVHGRIDLNEAEGLADLLFAETEGQRRAAMAMADGHFTRLLAGWQAELLRLSALVEAALDFSDEDDVPEAGVEVRIADGVGALLAIVDAERLRPAAERLRDGVRVVIAGPPNAGKSTLLNALVGRDAAIVSDKAGTTRDRIDVPIALGGIAMLMTDTAGLRDRTEDVIEAIGIARAAAAIGEADILLWLGASEDAPRTDALRIAPQCDQPGWTMPAGADMAVSARTGAGMDALTIQLIALAGTMLPREGEYALHRRQRDAIGHLAGALHLALEESDMLILAEHLRQARGAIDALTGRAGTEDMLDTLFGGFCIGK